MQRVKTSSAVTSRPAYTETGAPGYFTSGDPVAAIPATVPGAQWFNQVQGEILNAITAGGLTPDATRDDQLAQAIAQMIAAQAVTIEEATETVAGIIKLATISGAVRGYTAQQYATPVTRTDASGGQTVDCDAHQMLSITATGALAFAAPTHADVGKTVTILLYSDAAQAIAWDAAYVASASYDLPTTTTAGKWLVVSLMCHKAGELLLTGTAEEA